MLALGTPIVRPPGRPHGQQTLRVGAEDPFSIRHLARPDAVSTFFSTLAMSSNKRYATYSGELSPMWVKSVTLLSSLVRISSDRVHSGIEYILIGLALSEEFGAVDQMSLLSLG
jgi:hypothetical protein